MPAWLNRSLCGGIAANGTTGRTCTFTPAASGSLLVAVLGGAVTSTTPTGWTLVASAVNNGGLYVFSKTASASESTFATVHNAADYAVEAFVYEYPAGSSIVGTAGTATGQSVGVVVSGPSATSLTGSYTRFCARQGVITGPTNTTSTTWTVPSIEDVDVSTPHGSGDGVGLSIAYDDAQTGSSFTASSTMSGPTGGVLTGEGIAWAISVPSGVAATGTASISISASATASAAANSSGSLSIAASATAGGGAAGNSSLSLTATGTAGAAATGTASISLAATGVPGSGSVAATGTASLTLTATGRATHSGSGGVGVLAGMYQDTVMVATYLGRGARGDSYAAPVPVSCYVDAQRKLVLGQDGAETTSETTIYSDPDTLPLFASGSLVTLDDGIGKVISARNRRHPLAPEINHVEVVLA